MVIKNKQVISFLPYLAWVQALVATLTSLYYSEIAGYAPCLLCWYQRILMYPLVIIIAVGIILKDKKLPFYSLPLSIIGMGFAFFHILVENNIISESNLPCRVGVSCSTKYVNYFGFITIPLLSFLAFAFITACMVIFLRSNNK